jgi:hypothetical protein
MKNDGHSLVTTTSLTSTLTITKTVTPVTPGQQEEEESSGQCVCQPTAVVSTVYATVTATVAEMTTVTETKTVEPPFPSIHGTDKGQYVHGTGVIDMAVDSDAYPTTTGTTKGGWFQFAQAGHRHGHGHGHGR